jgi:hypothetical protein
MDNIKNNMNEEEKCVNQLEKGELAQSFCCE